MELSNEGKNHTAPPSESLLSEALHSGAQMLHKAENFVGEHKVAAVLGTAAVAATLVALSKGSEAGIAGEMVADSLGSISKESALATGRQASLLAADSTGILSRGLVHKGVLPLMTLSAVALAGCSQEEKQEKAQIYNNASDCEKDGVFSKAFCDTEYQKALEIHNQTVPQFKDQADCEDKTGLTCTADTTSPQPVSTTHGSIFFYRPYMMGYALSNAADRSDPNHKFIARTAPLYNAFNTPSTDFVTSHGDPVASKTGTVETSERALSTASKSLASGGSATEHITEHTTEHTSNHTSGVSAEHEGAFTRSTAIGESVHAGSAESVHVGSFGEAHVSVHVGT